MVFVFAVFIFLSKIVINRYREEKKKKLPLHLLFIQHVDCGQSRNSRHVDVCSCPVHDFEFVLSYTITSHSFIYIYISSHSHW